MMTKKMAFLQVRRECNVLRSDYNVTRRIREHVDQRESGQDDKKGGSYKSMRMSSLH